MLHENEWTSVESKDILLNEVLTPEGQWNTSALGAHLPDVVAKILQQSHVKLQEQADNLVWTHTYKGDFSTSSAWSALHHPSDLQFPFERLWHSLIPKKMSFFLRCAIENKISADSEVQKLGISLCSACYCCAAKHRETPEHILLHGAIARVVWSFFATVLKVIISPTDSLRIFDLRWSEVGSLRSRYGFTCYLLPFLICWNLWLARNQARFEGTKLSTNAII